MASLIVMNKKQPSTPPVAWIILNSPFKATKVEIKSSTLVLKF